MYASLTAHLPLLKLIVLSAELLSFRGELRDLPLGSGRTDLDSRGSAAHQSVSHTHLKPHLCCDVGRAVFE